MNRLFKISIVSVFIFILLVPQSIYAANENLDLLRRFDQKFNNGQVGTVYSEGENLAYTEGYQLNNYLLAYNKSGDTYWLDKYTSHLDAVQGKAQDLDGDGKLGWYSSLTSLNLMGNDSYFTLGPDYNASELVTNGSMETTGTGNTPDNWFCGVKNNDGSEAACDVSTSSKVTRTTEPDSFHAGSAALKLESYNGINMMATQTLPALELKKNYYLSFYGKTSDIKDSAFVEVYDATANKTIVTSPPVFDSKWKRYNVAFGITDITHQYKLRYYFNDPLSSSITAFLDDVSVKQLRYEAPLYGSDKSVNGGFETADAADATLPDGWARWNTVNNSTVYRSTYAPDVYDGTSSLVITDRNNSWQVLEQQISYIPGMRYTVSFNARTNNVSGTNAVGRVEVYNFTDLKFLNPNGAAAFTFSSTDWNNYSFDFVAPDIPGRTVKLRLMQQSYTLHGGKIYYDNIRIQPSPVTRGEQNFLVNSSFEQADSPANGLLPYGWSRWNGATELSIYRSGTSGDYSTGAYGVVVKNDDPGKWKVLEQQVDYIPGNVYILSARAKTNVAANGAKIEIYDYTDSKVLKSQTTTSTAWTTISTDPFAMPAIAGHNVRVRLYYQSLAGGPSQASFDNVELKLGGSYLDAIVNGTAELAAAGDATLPYLWTRGNTTTSGKAYRSNANTLSTSGSYGFVIGSDGNTQHEQMLQQRIYLVPGAKYMLTFQGRMNSTKANGVVEIYDETTSAVVGQSTISGNVWKNYRLSFTAPSAAGDKIYVRLKLPSYNDSSWEAYVDDLAITPHFTRNMGGWQLQSLTPDMAYADLNPDITFDASPYLVINSNGTTQGYVEYRVEGYDPGAPYLLKFLGKTNKADAFGKVIVYNETAQQEIASAEFNNTSWSGFDPDNPLTLYHNLSFGTPANGTDVITVKLGLKSYSDATWKAYFDSVQFARNAEYQIHDTMLGNAAMGFVKTVNKDPRLAAYAAKANTYRAYVVANVYEKWQPYYVELSPTEAAYKSPANAGTALLQDMSLPKNQYENMAVVILSLADTESDPVKKQAYLDQAVKIMTTVKNHLGIRDGNPGDQKYLYWKYWDSLTADDAKRPYATAVPYAEDTSHANVTVDAILQFYNRGLVFDDSYPRKLVNNFKDKIWNGSHSVPLLSYSMWGENITNPSTNWSQYTPVLFGWGNLVQFDSSYDIYRVGEEIWKTNPYVRYYTLGPLVAWGKQNLMNNGMETVNPDDTSLPVGWETEPGTVAGSVYRDLSQAYAGDAGLTLKTDGATPIYAQQQFTYVPNSDYVLSFYGKAEDSGAGKVNGYVDIFDKTANTVVASTYFTDTAWTAYTLNFSTPSVAGHEVYVRLSGTDWTIPDKRIFFDEVRIVPDLSDSETANSGFETPDYADPTLPLYWNRSGNASAFTVSLDSSEQVKGAQSVKLATNPVSGEQSLSYDLNGLQAGETYRLTFYAKTNGSAAQGKVSVTNSGTALFAPITINSTAWAQYQTTFVAPSQNFYENNLKLILTHANPVVAGGTVWFDQVAVTVQ
ncbi:carbohydrate binding domain-containing protein [Paenibacillus sp. MBLB4367]|uniref:carbohydrate binding domain-containing protein n=1 Tax=Paenibacillus sp. MBLB4367 TaxID=3384767 RepID=UPI0039080E86